MRKFRSLAQTALVAAALVVTSCGTEVLAQGVTDTTVKIGNAATVTGAYAAVGIPFNAGLKARLEVANATPIGGRTIEFVTYDDGGLAYTGTQMTEKLVEDDEVFALVGHFGTWTVGATLPYLRDKGIPMVYAATGINQLYFEESPGNPIFAVQPIYRTEGRMLVARVYKEADLFGSVDKLGVIYTTEDAGYSILTGVEQQATEMGKTAQLVKAPVAPGSDYSAAVNTLSAADVDAVIIATNQAYFGGILNAMSANGLEAPVLTSYVSAATGYIPEAAVTANRPVYVNAWVDIASDADQYTAFSNAINNATTLSELEKTYSNNPALVAFAIAGYVAADIFITGLSRVDASDKALTWENYIAAMEEAPVDFPLGGPVDFTGGKRHGLESLALLKADHVSGVYTLVQAKPLEDLATVLAK